MSRSYATQDAAILVFCLKTFLPVMALCAALALYASELPWLAKAYLLVINAVTFCVYAYDKHRAIRDEWRIPELHLYVLSLAGGAIGAELGRRLCRHKIRKWSFTLVISIGLVVLGIVAASGLKQAKLPAPNHASPTRHIASSRTPVNSLS
ncbi:hypothetical protein R69919_04164 [Paraburkholderia gardini]|nr:hypothetical protein R69919_04164 [Paraburkholderia gardini]